MIARAIGIAVNAGALVVLWAWAATLRPDARANAPWWLGPLVGTAAAAALVGFATAVRTLRWFNLPNKDDLLALPPERQAAVVERLRVVLYGIALFTTAVQAAAVGAAAGRVEAVWVVVLAVGSTPAILIALVLAARPE